MMMVLFTFCHTPRRLFGILFYIIYIDIWQSFVHNWLKSYGVDCFCVVSDERTQRLRVHKSIIRQWLIVWTFGLLIVLLGVHDGEVHEPEQHTYICSLYEYRRNIIAWRDIFWLRRLFVCTFTKPLRGEWWSFWQTRLNWGFGILAYSLA